MYHYSLVNNHYIVDIYNKKYLLDTGCPRSFSMSSHEDKLLINDRNYYLASKPYNVDLKGTQAFVGCDVDGFIGIDIIKVTGLTIYKEGFIDFSVNEIAGTEIDMVNYPGYFVIEAGSSIGKINYMIDTGAKYGYGVSKLFNGLTPYDNVYDYSPTFGQLKSDIYHVDIQIGGFKTIVDVCDSKRIGDFFRQMGVSLIANITPLFKEVCVFDVYNNKLIIR